MGRKTEEAYFELRKSRFTWHDEHTLEVVNAVILWPNFAGRPNKFGNAARTFNLCVTPQVATQLEQSGWRVRSIQVDSVRDENDEPVELQFVNIKVNMDSVYPPAITLFTFFKGRKSRRLLDSESIGELDTLDFKTTWVDEATGEGEDQTGIDCIINCYESRKFPGKITGYLKKLFATQEDTVEFGGKYDDWDEEVYEDKSFPRPDEFPER